MLVLAFVAFVGSVLCAPGRASRAESLMSALSQSLGGMRVLLVDIMILKAEQAQRRGDLEDAAMLYRTLLEMQPDNAPALAHLVDIEYDALRYVLDPEERFRAWRDLRRRLGDMIALRPASARLRHRDAMLILDPLLKNDELADRIRAALPEPDLQALRRLGEAAMLREVLPRRGTIHIELLATKTIEVAADALRRDATEVWQEALHIGRLVLELRSEVLGLTRHLLVEPPDLDNPDHYIPLYDVLRLGIETVERVAPDRHAPQARQAVAAFEARVGDNLRAAAMLREAVGGE